MSGISHLSRLDELKFQSLTGHQNTKGVGLSHADVESLLVLQGEQIQNIQTYLELDTEDISLRVGDNVCHSDVLNTLEDFGISEQINQSLEQDYSNQISLIAEEEREIRETLLRLSQKEVVVSDPICVGDGQDDEMIDDAESQKLKNILLAREKQKIIHSQLRIKLDNQNSRYQILSGKVRLARQNLLELYEELEREKSKLSHFPKLVEKEKRIMAAQLEKSLSARDALNQRKFELSAKLSGIERMKETMSANIKSAKMSLDVQKDSLKELESELSILYHVASDYAEKNRELRQKVEEKEQRQLARSNQSAAKIQRLWINYQERKAYQKKIYAIKCVQRIWKNTHRIRKLELTLLLERKHKSAIMIQALFRGYRIRKLLKDLRHDESLNEEEYSNLFEVDDLEDIDFTPNDLLDDLSGDVCLKMRTPTPEPIPEPGIEERLEDEWGFSNPTTIALALKKQKRMRRLEHGSNIRQKQKDPLLRFKQFKRIADNQYQGLLPAITSEQSSITSSVANPKRTSQITTIEPVLLKLPSIN